MRLFFALVCLLGATTCFAEKYVGSRLVADQGASRDGEPIATINITAIESLSIDVDGTSAQTTPITLYAGIMPASN